MNFFNKSLFWKFALPTSALFVVCIIAMAFFVPNLLKQSAVAGAVANAEETVTQFKTLRQYYTENVVEKLADRSDVEFSENHKQNQSLPLPATVILDMGDLLKNEGTTLQVYSPYPFPNRKGRTLDQFSREAWAYLKNNPDGVYTKLVEENGKKVVRVAMPDRMTSQSCVNCHNMRADSAKRDWQLGDLGGVLEVGSNIDGVLAAGIRTSLWVVLGVIGLALAVMGFAYYIFKKRITAPLSNASAVAKSISEGDLAVNIDRVSEDEVGQLLVSLKMMQAKLVDILGDMQGGPDAIAHGSHEISCGIDDLSQRTQEQAAALEETASSMEQMTATVKQNSDNASRANQLAMSAREQAERGGSVVTEAIAAMQDINHSSQKISEIIGVIDEIAFQTNLLALNAAVEAARAGDQGRGFAVVASEVRSLAQRSAGAAKEIKELIQDSSGKVEVGSTLVDRSGATLKEIMEGIKKVSDIVAEISAASQEQSAGIEQVNNAVMQMDEVTQQNAALVEQTAAASHSMSEQAIRLRDRLGYFQFAKQAAGTSGELANGGEQVASAKRAYASSNASAGHLRSQAGRNASDHRPLQGGGRHNGKASVAHYNGDDQGILQEF